MKIIDKVIDKRDAILGPDGAAVADENQRLAIAAVIGGLSSTAWRTFMQQFANNPAQLSRLVAEDNTDGAAMDKRRAYMIGNAICGLPTGRTTAREVETIDQALPLDQPTDTPDCSPTPPRVVFP